MNIKQPAKILVCLVFGLLLPVIIFTAAAQKKLPRFEEDTLYTVTGYKLYPGQKLSFGQGTGRQAGFRYINTQGTANGTSLAGAEFTLVSMRDFGISQLNNAYVYMYVHIIYKDGSKGGLTVHIAFDNAIRNRELNIPEQDRFINTDEMMPAHNLPRFKNDTLYTSNGGRIYPGMDLRIGKGTDKRGGFRYFKFLYGTSNKIQADVAANVISLRKFGTDDDGEGRIEMSYSFKKENGIVFRTTLRIVFDKAIESGELILPGQ